MPDRSIEHLGRITTEPAPEETGPEAKKTKEAEKAVAMGKVTNPEDAARASAADAHRDEEDSGPDRGS